MARGDGMRKKMVRDWRDDLKIGDVLYEGGDPQRPRIIRRISHRAGFLGCVTFVILHCSWTHRCYTLVNRSDLKWRKFSKAPFRVKEIRDKFHEEFLKNCDVWTDYKSLDCCDVKGIR